MQTVLSSVPRLENRHNGLCVNLKPPLRILSLYFYYYYVYFPNLVIKETLLTENLKQTNKNNNFLKSLYEVGVSLILAVLLSTGQPKTSLSFGPSYVVKGKNITLPACHVTGYPSPKISWHKVPGNLVQARTVMKDGRLSIMNAYKSDSGLYKCEASNNLGHDSAVTQLNVVELPHFTVSPPSQLNVSTVQNITVPCQAAGDPQPTIMWRKEGGKLPAGRSSASADGTLKIWNLREREDSGRYTCVASSNQFFMAFSVMDVIIVQHKGEFKLEIQLRHC